MNDEGLVTDVKELVRQVASQLLYWLVAEAYPLWATLGSDFLHGGFHESLDQDGYPREEPRRIRVQARQVYVFARAPSLGWAGDAVSLVNHGLAYVRRHYRRPDGLFRSVVAPDGTPVDDRVLLYDQAFVLLALAESQKVLGPQPELLEEGRQLRETLYRLLKRRQGFSSGIPDTVPLLSNPHMHLLEAAMAWMEVSSDPAWRALAEQIVELALSRLIDPVTGALREQFAADWSVLGAEVGPPVEPGHLFEWAWLLLRWCRAQPGLLFGNAVRLVAIGETHGVRGGVGVNALSEKLDVRDGAARLWVQTERVKAANCLARCSDTTAHWSTLAQAIAGLRRYLRTRTPGLWHDLLDGGVFVPGPAPASTFYHIVSAIAELNAPYKQGQTGAVVSARE
jgi:mannose/cellobiose epimerase-like protein (N-acyl-D-glucosamine 2-epimerase family)